MLLRLGIITDDKPISDAALERYNKLFERPLAGDIVQAFADFYGWHVPTNVASLHASAPTSQPRLVEV